MGILKPFTSPTDPRWHGFQSHHHTLWLIKSALLIPFIILVIVEYALFKTWWESGSYSYHKTWEWAPYHFWLRIGLALVPDLLLTLITLILIFNPLHRATYSFHPVFALVTSICMLGLYVNASLWNPLIALSNEVAFPNMRAWETIVWVETGMQGFLGCCWIGMVVGSAVAVHCWRMGRKGVQGSGREEVRV